jgi:hypothetical protein
MLTDLLKKNIIEIIISITKKPKPKYMVKNVRKKMSKVYPMPPRNELIALAMKANFISFCNLLPEKAKPTNIEESPKKTVQPSMLMAAMPEMGKLCTNCYNPSVIPSSICNLTAVNWTK